MKAEMFDRYVYLGTQKSPGICREIYDGRGNLLWNFNG